MIHRRTVGAMERVTAALLEHYQGRLPLWQAPVQAHVTDVAAGFTGLDLLYPVSALQQGYAARTLRLPWPDEAAPTRQAGEASAEICWAR